MQACLARWTLQDDVVVGVPSLGRFRPELEQVIGYFVNMLPMRSQISSSTTFLQVQPHSGIGQDACKLAHQVVLSLDSVVQTQWMLAEHSVEK